MCNGPLLGKILVFTFPLMLSGVLQLLFNAADIVVVGRFSGAHALAAVGSTSALINLLVNVFMGLSIGTNVLTAQGYGARNEEDVSDTVHTSVLLSLVSGVILIVAGVLFSRPLLELMATPEEVLGQAALYMKIYFIGMPAMMAYNFGAAILRAIGDTKRPLYYLSVCCRSAKCSPEPDLCDHFQDGSGRSGDSHCDFPGHFRRHGLKMPDGTGWHVPPGTSQAGHPQG